jgi:hypothetical protein
MVTDFFENAAGDISGAEWRRFSRLLSIVDVAYDGLIARYNKVAIVRALMVPPQKLLLAAIEVPGREKELQSVVNSISASAVHHVTQSIAPMGQRGKFDNINNILARHRLCDFDWILITDDDVALPSNFLDLFLYYCIKNKLKLAMPAHRFLSHKTFAITERNCASTVRLTNFVEIGPITIIHRDAFSSLIPFPSLRYAWGLDVLWSAVAMQQNWTIGIVDATPIRHLRPIAGTYGGDVARKEAEAFLDEHSVTLSRAEIMSKNIRV